MKSGNYFLICIILLFNLSLAKAQTTGPFKAIRHKLLHNAITNGQKTGAGQSSFTLNAGTATYTGDLCDGGGCVTFRPSFGIGYMYRFNQNFSFRSELNYYHLYSKDYYPARNLSFRSDNFELYGAAKYDFIPYDPHHAKRKLLNPFAFLGLGLTRFNPKAELNGHWYALQPLQTEGHKYSRTALIIPFGLGVKISCSQAIDFIVEGGLRKAFTDHLDDVSADHYQQVSSFNDPVAAALSNRSANPERYWSQRGNPHKRDWYYLIQLKVVYSPRHKHITY
jgi:hypothetical protein